MTRLPKAAAAVLVCTLGFAACAGDDRGAGDSRPDAETSSAASNGSDGRIAHGCALVRGGLHADATMRHYSGFAVHALFRAALEAEPGRVLAARLWDAADHLRTDDSSGPRSALLKICSSAGFDDMAGLPELRAHACDVTAELALERPDVMAYGPESTKVAPGDPLRTDVEFLEVAHLLLSVKESPAWLDSESLRLALASGDDVRYQAALDHFEEMCSLAASPPQ